MEIKITEHFEAGYHRLPDEIRQRARKQIALLVENLKHPSLGVKKIKGEKDIWEARVTRDYRLTFQIGENTYILRKIGKHEEVLRSP